MCGKIITVENKKTRKRKQIKFCKIMAVQKFTHRSGIWTLTRKQGIWTLTRKQRQVIKTA
jgi:hypothetical protein